MKKFLAMTVVSLAATSALASVKLVVRSDYVNTPNYDDSAATEVSGSSLFVPNVARLYLSGNVGDAVIDAGLNLRAFTAVDDGTQIHKMMTVDQFVDHLTIAKTYGEWTFTAGKLWSNVGGFERRATWDGDTYLTSAANGGAGGAALATLPVGATGSIVTPANLSGVAAAYAIDETNKVEVQVMNQTNAGYMDTATGSDTATNKQHLIGLAYWGSFVDGMVKPYLSYNAGAADTATEGYEQSFMAAGFRLAPMENLSLDLEYMANTNKEKSTGDKDETTSTILEARYASGNWVPVLKYEMSDVKTLSVDTFKRNAFAVALEYVPTPEDAFRYHVAYTNVADDYDTADKVTFSTITVGFKYAGDIAK